MELSKSLKDSIIEAFEEIMPSLLNQALKRHFGSHEIKSENTEHNDVIRIDRVQEITGYATSTIYSKVNRNELPVLSKGRPLLFSESHIMLWIQAGRPMNSNIDEIKNMLKTD